MKNLLKNPNLIKIGQKFRKSFMQTQVPFIVVGDIKLTEMISDCLGSRGGIKIIQTRKNIKVYVFHLLASF